MDRGLFKRPSMKKEATPKNTKGFVQKNSDKKRQAQKAGAKKRGPQMKEATLTRCFDSVIT
jgi:hypothetical protein